MLTTRAGVRGCQSETNRWEVGSEFGWACHVSDSGTRMRLMNIDNRTSKLQYSRASACSSLLHSILDTRKPCLQKQRTACVEGVCLPVMRIVFFFQAEDGIRDHCVTGVQTCALPI